jgi:hypothetical protein
MLTNPLRVYKEIGALPEQLYPDSIYFVRTGTGFELHLTDNTGAIAHKLNDPKTLESPVFTYTGSQLTGVTYSDGTTKVLSYASGLLSQLDKISLDGVTVRKQYAYNPNGTLASIAQERLMPAYIAGRLTPVRKGTWKIVGENTVHDGTTVSMSLGSPGYMVAQPFTDYASLSSFLAVGLRVTVAGVGSSPIMVGIYGNIADPVEGDKPHNLVWSGTVDSTVAGLQPLTTSSFPLPLSNAVNPAALYWVVVKHPETTGTSAVSVAGGPTTSGVLAGGSTSFLGRDPATGVSYVNLYAVGVTGALPTVAPAMTPAIYPAATPLVYYKV